MQSKAVEAALNKQLNEELYSAYLYMGMAARAERLGLPGFGHWFKSQYHEELAHADKIYTYILSRNGVVSLGAIAEPTLQGNADSALGLFEASLVHEEYISDCIFNLKDLARKESDHATDVFLEWFVREQIEEEASVRTVIDQLKLVGEQSNGLFMIDRELAARPAVSIIPS